MQDLLWIGIMFALLATTLAYARLLDANSSDRA